MVEATGHWANCDVWVQAPANWEDVVLVLVGHSGSIESVLDHRLVGSMEAPALTAPGWNGIILSGRGRMCDRFAVHAFRTTVDHDFAKFHMRLWNGDGSYGDRATRQPSDPYARPNQIQRYPSPVPFVVGALVPVIAANPTGGRIAWTGFEWSNDGAIGAPWPLLQITEQPSGTVLGNYTLSASSTSLHRDFDPPVWTARGQSLNAQILGAGGGASYINFTGFYE